MPSLDKSVKEVKGIGEERAKELQALDIHTIEDLLEYFPYRYEDYRIRPLHEVADGEKVTVKGQVYGEPSVQFYGRKKSRLSVRVVVDQTPVKAVWFNRHFIKKQLRSGKELILTGKWDRRRKQITVSRHAFADSKRGKEMEGTLEPVYSVTTNLSNAFMQKIIREALAAYGTEIDEILPEELVKKYKLMPRAQAIEHIHFPAMRSRASWRDAASHMKSCFCFN